MTENGGRTTYHALWLAESSFLIPLREGVNDARDSRRQTRAAVQPLGGDMTGRAMARFQ